MLLGDADRNAVRDRWKALAGPVSATLTTQAVIPGRTDCSTCPTTEALLEELEGLSSDFSVDVRHVEEHPDGRIPVIELRGQAKGRIRFVGLPDGHEFGSFVDAAVAVSGAPATLSGAALERLEALAEPVHIQVFTTPT